MLLRDKDLPALLTKLNTSILKTAGFAEGHTSRRGHGFGINIVGRVEGTVVVGGFAVAALIGPIGVGNWLDSGGTGWL